MSESQINLKDNSANPAPLGLFGFAMTTFLLNIHNAGFTALDSMIWSMGIFFGGLGQIFVGWMEWKKNNTFGMTAFMSYGLFWMTLVGLWAIGIIVPTMKPAEDAMAMYLGSWGFFSLCMWFGTFRINKALNSVFGTLTLLFFLLAARDFLGFYGLEAQSKIVGRIAGFEGLLCAACAFYAGIAQVLNPLYGKEILPLGHYKGGSAH